MREGEAAVLACRWCIVIVIVTIIIGTSPFKLSSIEPYINCHHGHSESSWSSKSWSISPPWGSNQMFRLLAGSPTPSLHWRLPGGRTKEVHIEHRSWKGCVKYYSVVPHCKVWCFTSDFFPRSQNWSFQWSPESLGEVTGFNNTMIVNVLDSMRISLVFMLPFDENTDT